MNSSVFVDESTLSILKELAKKKGCYAGLIIGQAIDSACYIAHLSATVEPKEESNANKEPDDKYNYVDPLPSMKNFDDKWISAHTKNVIRMLPGGMNIVGVFCIGEENEPFIKLRALAGFVHREIKYNIHAFKVGCQILLHYSPNAKKFNCKSFEAGTLTAELQRVNLRIVNEPIKWFQIDSSVCLENFEPHVLETADSPIVVKKAFQEYLEKVKEKIHNCECSLNGCFIGKGKTLDELNKSMMGDGSPVHEKSFMMTAQLYNSKKVKNVETFEVEFSEKKNIIKLEGTVKSRVFLAGGATVREAIQAVKEDIIKACGIKFEMYWETSDELCTKSVYGDQLVYRVLSQIPQSCIQFSDYLFADEESSIARSAFWNNLSFSNDIEVLEPIKRAFKKEQVKKSSKASVDSTKSMAVYILIVSVLCLLVAILFQMLQT